MKEKIINCWERFDRQMDHVTTLSEKTSLFNQAFGALQFAMELLNNWDTEDELIQLWENKWKPHFENKVWGY